MKKILTVLTISVAAKSFALNTATINSFPRATSIGSNYVMMVEIPGAAYRSVTMGSMLDSVWNYSSYVFNLQQNITNINQAITNLNLNVTNISTYNPAIEDGYLLEPSSQTNILLDFGRTNNAGLKLVYASYSATNDVVITGLTNFFQWSILSVNIVASGADRNIYVPSTWPHFNTQNWELQGSKLHLTLTNGNELRLTLQTNITLSTTWATFGQ